MDIALKEVLGQGGWSLVRRGVFHGRPVAVKTFNPQAKREVPEPELRERFRREAGALCHFERINKTIIIILYIIICIIIIIIIII